MRPWLAVLSGYTLTPHEAAAARHGFTAFAFVLSSYFILLPLREDVALTLGPALLPRLFTASLFVTAAAAPLVTAYVVNPASGCRAVGFRRLCRLMAGCLLVLFLPLLLTSPDPWALTRLLRLTPASSPVLELARSPAPTAPARMGDVAAGHTSTAAAAYLALLPPAPLLLQQQPQQQQPLGEVGEGGGQHRETQRQELNEQAAAAVKGAAQGDTARRQLGAGAVPVEGVVGELAEEEATRRRGRLVPLSWYGNAVRVCFYVYLSLQSLLSTSALWSVCADTFTAAASTKLYG
ncbi:hypothetical protein Agub_g11831, partial [Astrephomene gubernaculifera]